MPPGPLFGERRSEGCLLQQEDKIMDGKDMFFFLFVCLFEKDLEHTHKKRGGEKDTSVESE